MNPSFKDLVNRFAAELELSLGAKLSRTECDTFIQLTAPETTKIFLYPEEQPTRHQTSDPSIHIDQDQLEQKFSLVIQRIVAKIKNNRRIFARHTVVARIDKKVSMQFLVEHHLQVAIPGKYRYGLYEQGELVSIAVFSGGRRMNDSPESYRSFELLRFCNKSGYNVIGGLSKLIKAFCADFSPGDIMTFTDRDWSQDSSLEKIGFVKKEISGPIHFWVDATGRYPYRSQEELRTLVAQHPKGFLKENLGSIKMILYIK